MFIITARVHRRRLVCCAAAAVFVCAAAAFVLSGGRAAETLSPGAQAVRTNEDRVAYLERLGWQVAEEPAAIEELRLPREFDESYKDYLALQSAQGFDLTALAGRRVKRYTYSVTNYPTGESGVLADLLVCRNAVVGGDIFSDGEDGFLRSLDYPS